MGSLNHFDLSELTSNLEDRLVFVETGTGRGQSFECAMKSGLFDELHTIEFDRVLFEEARRRWGQCCHLGRSVDVLPGLLDKTKSYLFWLDAHFPLADFRGISHDASYERFGTEVAMPLEAEIKIIVGAGVRCNLVIDDLWVWEEGPFHAGRRWPVGERHGLTLDLALLRGFELDRSFDDHGYLIARQLI